MIEPLLDPSSNSGGDLHSNDNIAFEGPPYISPVVKYCPLLLFLWNMLVQGYSYVTFPPTLREVYIDRVFWPQTMVGLAFTALLVPFLMWFIPLKIELTSSGSLVLTRLWFSTRRFEGVESAQANRQICWLGVFRRMKTDYSTSLKNRVVVKLNSGTEVLVSPGNVDSFLQAVNKLGSRSEGSVAQGQLIMV